MSFDDQLKSFCLRKRVQTSRTKKQEANNEECMENNRQAVSKHGAIRRQDNEEEFLEKHRQQQRKRKAQRKEENEDTIHQIMFISPFPTPFDHFHFPPTLEPKPMDILKSCCMSSFSVLMFLKETYVARPQ